MLRPDVAAGMRVLERHGLSFDAVAERPDLLAQVPIVARRHPGMTVVLDHLGKPPIAAGSPADRADWARLIRQCAAEPGVVAKISGLNTASTPGWTADDWRPYVDIALEAFGPGRLMIGSDWPVALRQAHSYGSVVAALLQVLDGLTPDERDQVLQGTARARLSRALNARRSIGRMTSAFPRTAGGGSTSRPAPSDVGPTLAGSRWWRDIPVRVTVG